MVSAKKNVTMLHYPIHKFICHLNGSIHELSCLKNFHHTLVLQIRHDFLWVPIFENLFHCSTLGTYVTNLSSLDPLSSTLTSAALREESFNLVGGSPSSSRWISYMPISQCFNSITRIITIVNISSSVYVILIRIWLEYIDKNNESNTFIHNLVLTIFQ